MLNKQAIIEKVNAFSQKFDLPVNAIVVGYGAAAVMHGVREDTRDIDVDMSGNHITWVDLQTAGPLKYHKGLTGDSYSVTPDIDAHPEEVPESKTVVIDGITCYSKEYLRECYIAFMNNPNRMEHKREQDRLTVEALSK